MVFMPHLFVGNHLSDAFGLFSAFSSLVRIECSLGLFWCYIYSGERDRSLTNRTRSIVCLYFYIGIHIVGINGQE